MIRYEGELTAILSYIVVGLIIGLAIGVGIGIDHGDFLCAEIFAEEAVDICKNR